MSRKTARQHESASSPLGTYPISTGTAEVISDEYRDGSYIIQVNGVPSSHINTLDPRDLDFEYMRWIAAILQHYVSHSPLAQQRRLRITHLGGAGCTLARWCVATWPESKNTVVEIDAELSTLIRKLFDLPRAPQLKIRADDAGTVIHHARDASRDIIIRDCFSPDITPKHLRSRDFITQAYRSLSEGGIYVANCGDHSDLQGARKEITILAETFPHCAVIADPPMLKGRRYGNIILIGAKSRLPEADSPQAAQLTKELLGGAVPARYVPYADLPPRLRG